MVDQGIDPVKDLKRLGVENISQIHASLTDSVTLDRDPRIDLRRIKRVLDKMGWSGWLVVERSRNAESTGQAYTLSGTLAAEQTRGIVISHQQKMVRK